jgi:hypothetical protein
MQATCCSLRDELLARADVAPVFEGQRDPVLDQAGKAHPDQDLIEGDQLGEVLARAPGGDQTEAPREQREHLGRMLSQDELPAPPLPAGAARVANLTWE